MTARLSKIAPCPRPGCREETRVNGYPTHYFVVCLCGWIGPVRNTESAAILAWNPRSDAEAERRGAMKIRFALRDLLLAMSGQTDGVRSAGFSVAVNRARAKAYRAIGEAIASGEVLPAKTKKGARKR